MYTMSQTSLNHGNMHLKETFAYWRASRMVFFLVPLLRSFVTSSPLVFFLLDATIDQVFCALLYASHVSLELCEDL